MKNNPRRKRSLLIVSVILLIVIINYLNPRMKGYNELLEADAMNVYSNGSLVGTFEEPQDILDTFNGTIVGVGVIDISRLNLKKSDFKELYTIEFVKNNKPISTIEMLVPKLKDESTERAMREFRKFNGEYVIMREDGYYFVFGQRFYDNLSGILAQLA